MQIGCPLGMKKTKQFEADETVLLFTSLFTNNSTGTLWNIYNIISVIICNIYMFLEE